ncbi:MAG: hypothetical protein RBR02_11025 [Desulfuromonadaceae bacterium]|nr:hypothetical protein [Desulfuromonadaceae bacterium]
MNETKKNQDEKIPVMQQLGLLTPRICSIPQMTFPENNNYMIYSKRELFESAGPKFLFKDAHSFLCARDQLAFLNPNRSIPFLKYLGKYVFPISRSPEVEMLS